MNIIYFAKNIKNSAHYSLIEIDLICVVVRLDVLLCVWGVSVC